MKSTSNQMAAFLLLLSFACFTPLLLAKKKDKSPETGASDQKRAVHALNRLAFGPRPGDVQQVVAMGVDRWIDMQLHPDKIPDSAIDARLAQLPTLHMSAKEITEDFPDPQMIKQVMDGRQPMPSDPARRAIYRVGIARLQEKKERKEQQQQAQSQPPQQEAMSAANTGEPAASDGAKTADELAAAAAADAAANPSSDSSMVAANSGTAPQYRTKWRRLLRHRYPRLRSKLRKKRPRRVKEKIVFTQT